jgi:acetyl esterase/lipase
MKILFSFLLACVGAAATVAAGLQTDIQYGKAGGASLLLDAYVPEGPGPFPAVILVHGGGWTGGDKSGGPKKGYMAPMQEPLQKAGFAWFSINYRLAPKFHYPACVEDVETAIRWVKEHALLYHLDLKRLALAGESAGGHLVGLVAVRMDESTRLAAVVPFYGRFDMATDLKLGDPLPASTAALFGKTTYDATTAPLLREASALPQVKAGLPPFLLVHGDVDQSVPYQQSVMLQAKLREVGVPCELITIKGGVHGMISWDAVAPHYKEQVVAWLKKTLDVRPAKE